MRLATSREGRGCDGTAGDRCPPPPPPQSACAPLPRRLRHQGRSLIGSSTRRLDVPEIARTRRTICGSCSTRESIRRSGRFGGDVGNEMVEKPLLLAALAEAAADSQLAQVRPCLLRRPSVAAGRRPLAGTPLRHKHEGVEGVRDRLPSQDNRPRRLGFTPKSTGDPSIPDRRRGPGGTLFNRRKWGHFHPVRQRRPGRLPATAMKGCIRVWSGTMFRGRRPTDTQSLLEMTR